MNVSRTRSSPGSGPRRPAFPTEVSGVSEGARTTCPLQWRGRAGISPASVSPFALNCIANLDRWSFCHKRHAQLCLELSALGGVFRIAQCRVGALVTRVEHGKGSEH